jgi:hypothetical protein
MQDGNGKDEAWELDKRPKSHSTLYIFESILKFIIRAIERQK